MTTTIAIEGIDGSGKGTQTSLLVEGLRRYGLTAESISFPQYNNTMAGGLIRQYLNGEFGSHVHPKLAALMYAVDRMESGVKVKNMEMDADVIVFDRHIGSNLAHQCARSDRGQVHKLREWISNFEYYVCGTESAALTVLLTVSIPSCQRNISKKGLRSYTDKAADMHESDVDHLSAAQAMYLELAEDFGWTVVDSMDGETQRSVEEISDEILRAALKACVPEDSPASKIDVELVAKAMREVTYADSWDSAPAEDRKVLLRDAKVAIEEVLRQVSAGYRLSERVS